MNSKYVGTKLKGFTLIELIIVIAIIAILAGSISLFATGFRRDAQIETNNNKAQMVYTAFQNILINCEINQDDTVFNFVEGIEKNGFSGELKYLVFQFSMSDSKVDDIITIIPQYSGDSSYDADRLWVDRKGRATDTVSGTTKERYAQVEKAISSYLDSTFEGTAIVYIDYGNYKVDSVIYYEPGVIDAPVSGETTYYDDNVGSQIGKLNTYVGSHRFKTTSTDTDSGFKCMFLMLESYSKQKLYYKNVGAHLGAYPKVDDFPEDIIS